MMPRVAVVPSCRDLIRPTRPRSPRAVKRTGGRPVGELTQPIGIIIAARRWRALGDGRDRLDLDLPLVSRSPHTAATQQAAPAARKMRMSPAAWMRWWSASWFK